MTCWWIENPWIMALSSDLYILLSDSDVETGHLEKQLLLSAFLVHYWYLFACIYSDGGKPCLSLRSNYCDFIISRYSRKMFWIEKPISPAIRKRMEEFSDKLLCLEKGLRGFHGKGGSSEPRKPSLFLCNVSLSFDCGCTFSEFLHVIHTRQGHWGGNLSPNHGGFHVIV